MGVRKHYMTLNFRDNTEVTHISRNGVIEVCFEQACNRDIGFKTLYVDISGNVLKNIGFSDSEVDFFRRFTIQSSPAIIAESKGEI